MMGKMHSLATQQRRTLGVLTIGLPSLRLAAAIALGLALTYSPGVLHAQSADQSTVATSQADTTGNATTGKPADKTKAKDQTDVTNLVSVTVTGIRASLASAQSLKQNADQMVDSVTASDINAMPDRSVTETLQRISGVTVDHFLADDDPDHPSAEGSGVLIHGLPYVNSLLNGADSFSANNGRALGFEDVPSELMQGVDVYKSPTADLIEGGIAGTVNLRTRMPFDNPGQVIGFSTGVNEGDQSKKSKPAASFLYSNRWQTENLGEIGALFDVSYSSLASRNDGIQTNPYVLRPDATDTSYYAPNIAAGSPTSIVAVPGDINWQQMDLQRRRLGLYGAVQWRPNSSLEIYSRFFRSNYNLEWDENQVQTNEGNYSNVLPDAGTEFNYNNQGVFQSGTLASNAWRGTPAAAPGSGVEYYATSRVAKQFTQTTDWSNGFKYSIKDNLRLTGELQLVKSTSNSLDFSVFNQFYMPPANLNLTGGVPSLTVTDPSFFANPANYYVGAAMDHVERDYAIERAARLDLEYDFDDNNWLQYTKVGVRATDRDASSDNNPSNYNWGAISQPWQGGYTGPASLAWLNTIPSSMSQQITLPNFYGGANVPTTLWFPSMALLSNYQKAIPQLEAIELNGGWKPTVTGTPGLQNGLNEKTQAAYAMLFFGNETALGIPFDGNIGLRFVDTSVSANGSVTYPAASTSQGTLTPDQVAYFSGAYIPIAAKNHYHNLLPSLNLRFKLTNDLQMRFAADKAISRPSIGQLNSYLQLGAAWGGPAGGQQHITGFTGTTQGNTLLKPMEATQFDSSLEWYFGPTSELYTTVFYKNIKNYINTETQDQLYQGQVVTVTSPFNDGSGKVKGAEVGYSQFFDFLPGAFKGLGVQANYTFLQSSKVLGTASCDPDHANGSCASQYAVTNPPLPMAGLSPHSYNFTAMYEYSKWSARLAWSWRSRYLITSEDTGDTYLPMWSAAGGTLDGSVFYHFTKNIQVGLQMNNLTNATTRVLMGPSTYAATGVASANPGFVDYNLYTRSIFQNDRRFELVFRATF